MVRGDVSGSAVCSGSATDRETSQRPVTARVASAVAADARADARGWPLDRATRTSQQCLWKLIMDSQTSPALVGLVCDLLGQLGMQLGVVATLDIPFAAPSRLLRVV